MFWQSRDDLLADRAQLADDQPVREILCPVLDLEGLELRLGRFERYFSFSHLGAGLGLPFCGLLRALGGRGLVGHAARERSVCVSSPLQFGHIRQILRNPLGLEADAVGCGCQFLRLINTLLGGH